MWSWFNEWIDRKGDNEYLQLFIGNNNAALVHERPLDFSEGSDYQNMSHPDGSKGKYNDQFNALWGSSNLVIKWDDVMSTSKMRDGICQGLGLDFLGTALRIRQGI